VIPGGGAALVTVRADDPAEVRIAIVDLDTGLADTLGLGAHPTYASGYIVFSRQDSTILAQAFDPEARRTTGPALPLVEEVALDGALGMGQFTISNGTLAYHTGGGTVQTLMLMDRNGTIEVPLPVQTDLEEPTFSPDGRRIALRVTSQIWIWDRDQETFEQLTVDGSMNMGPVWHPDGKRVAFMSHREGASQGQIYWQATDGRSGSAPLLATDYQSRPDSWSPSGDALFLVGTPGDNADIGMLALGDASPHWLINSASQELDPQPSPDGRWLAYSASDPGDRQVYVQALDGQGERVQISRDGGHSPRWAPDGRTLYYGRSTGAEGIVMAATLSFADGIRVVSREERFAADNLGRGGIGNYDVGPDGEEFVFLRNTTSGARAVVWIFNWREVVRSMTGMP
jgi:Tol biopolymer transport system component